MKKICYHAISDHNSEFLNTLEDVKTSISKWKEDGDSKIKLYKIMTEETGADYINLEEERVPLENLFV